MSTDFVLDWIERKVDCARLPPPWSTAVGALGCHPTVEPLIVAAAIFFNRIDVGILSNILAIGERQLTADLQTLADAGILHRAALPGGPAFSFADPDLRHAARSAIPPHIRTALHRDAAVASRRCSSGRNKLENAVEVARQWQACGEWQPALDSWRLAAQTAVAEGDLSTAADCIEQALALCRTRPDDLPAQQEILTLSALGPLQAQLSGSGSERVAQTYARCLEIIGGLDASEAAAMFDVLWGLSACILVHGRVGTALELCERLLISAKIAGKTEQILLSNRLKGLGQLLAGQLPDAIGTLREVVGMYEFGAHASLRFNYASDQSALALAQLAWAQAISGDLTGSELSSAQALEQAHILNHPHTSAHVTCVLAARAQTLGLRSDAATLATAGQALASHHRYPYWQAWSAMILGWYDGGRNPEVGLARIAGAIADYKRTGAGQALPFAHLLRAGLALDHGWRAQAFAATNEAVQYAEAHGVEMFDAEITRVQALTLIVGDRQRGVLLEQAHRTAQRQGAALFADRIVAAQSGHDH